MERSAKARLEKRMVGKAHARKKAAKLTRDSKSAAKIRRVRTDFLKRYYGNL
jgi:hypothetical protein